MEKKINYEAALSEIEEIVNKMENDEFDTGERMLLNFGHTFGHAVEKLGNERAKNRGEKRKLKIKPLYFARVI